MSRLTKKPIKIPSGVTVREDAGFLLVTGPKGERRVRIEKGSAVRIEGEDLWVEGAGTTWALARNAIQGVTDGFMKILEIEGVGYRVVVEGKELVLYLGYAEPVRMKISDGVSVAVEKSTIKIMGIDKDLVGRTAADIRAQKKPEPYKGKGIRYQGEVIRRKVGKKAAATATA